MKFKEFDTVRVLKKCYPSLERTAYNRLVQIGDIGSIIMTFDKPCEAYEIEFVNENGEIKAQCVFLPNEIEIVKS